MFFIFIKINKLLRSKLTRYCEAHLKSKISYIRKNRKTYEKNKNIYLHSILLHYFSTFSRPKEPIPQRFLQLRKQIAVVRCQI